MERKTTIFLAKEIYTERPALNDILSQSIPHFSCDAHRFNRAARVSPEVLKPQLLDELRRFFEE